MRRVSELFDDAVNQATYMASKMQMPPPSDIGADEKFMLKILAGGQE